MRSAVNLERPAVVYLERIVKVGSVGLERQHVADIMRGDVLQFACFRAAKLERRFDNKGHRALRLC